MRTPRKFTLINASGDTVNVTEQDSFFYNPQGLGYERSNTYRQVGDRFILVNTQLRQQLISGRVSFVTEDPYEAYFSFSQFCGNFPLILTYQPNPAADDQSASSVVYRRRVLVTRIEKSEINKYGTLDISIEFTCLTPWYKKVDIYSDPNVSDDAGLDNIFKWPSEPAVSPPDIGPWPTGEVFDQGVVFGTDVLMNATILSDSYNDSPCRISIYGPITNPKWTQYVNGVKYGTGALTGSIRSGQKLVVDNTTDPYVIGIYTTDDILIENVYQNADFSTERFIDIQYGENLIRFSGEDSEGEMANVPIGVEALIYYDSV